MAGRGLLDKSGKLSRFANTVFTYIFLFLLMNSGLP